MLFQGSKPAFTVSSLDPGVWYSHNIYHSHLRSCFSTLYHKVTIYNICLFFVLFSFSLYVPLQSNHTHLRSCVCIITLYLKVTIYYICLFFFCFFFVYRFPYKVIINDDNQKTLE